ncbi:MAG TPA: hypothetical protein VM580_27360 [Labilithrix sp.]|nr:hypothetical protein [Labilithrix sp.]
MTNGLTIQGLLVTGEITIDVPPGTTAQARDRAIDAALSDPLTDAAERLGAALAAPPHRFVRMLPGKDDAGLTRFTVRGRVEGGRLMPDRAPR